MTTTTSSAARCDRIISLIDECLADVDARLRVIAGDGRPPTRNVVQRVSFANSSLR